MAIRDFQKTIMGKHGGAINKDYRVRVQVLRKDDSSRNRLGQVIGVWVVIPGLNGVDVEIQLVDQNDAWIPEAEYKMFSAFEIQRGDRVIDLNNNISYDVINLFSFIVKPPHYVSALKISGDE